MENNYEMKVDDANQEEMEIKLLDPGTMIL